MPIKGLTEKRRLPRLGKIHLGVKKKNDKGVEYPSAVDYFVCPPEVQKLFGEKPIELRIMVPVEDEERWASQYYRCYSMTRGLICKGDGETAIRMVDKKTGAIADKNTVEVVMKEISCKGRECPDYRVQCKEVMNLQFLIPEVPGLGIWQIDTGSINSIQNINSAAELIKRLYGHIAMLPLLLTLETQDAKTPEGKRKTIWVLNLRTRETLASLMGVSVKSVDQILLPNVTEDDELPIGDDEIPELIIPQAQDPGQNKPKQVVTPVEATHMCPIHNVELKRNEKGSNVWYSHRLDNGGYCNGNAPYSKPKASATAPAAVKPTETTTEPPIHVVSTHVGPAEPPKQAPEGKQGLQVGDMASIDQWRKALEVGHKIPGFKGKTDDDIVRAVCTSLKAEDSKGVKAGDLAGIVAGWENYLVNKPAQSRIMTAESGEPW